ncbi:DNA-binding Lrp family transcriptional regulator [Bradyrhizobium sp. USDA 326]
MAGDIDYMLRVVIPDMQSYDTFYKKLIHAVPLKNVTSRFAMERSSRLRRFRFRRWRRTSFARPGRKAG